MSDLDKLYNLVKTLNMNDENREKICGVSTYFIIKLTDFFFIIIGEKSSTNIPVSKMYHLRKNATLTCLYGTMYLELDDYPPYILIKYQSFFRHKLTKTWYVVMDIPIALHILIWSLGYPNIIGKCYFMNFHIVKE